MTQQSKWFFENMLIFFPEKEAQYHNMECKYGMVLETVALESLFVPCIVELLEKENDVVLISQVFDCFEKVSTCNDKHLLNIFSTTILEYLGNDVNILQKAKKYMGPKTILLQSKADRELGRKTELNP